MDDIILAFIPIIAISMPIAIVWINKHYKHKERSMGHMSADQMAELEQMSKIADILDQRVNVLERILDDEVPNWRTNQHQDRLDARSGRSNSNDKTI